MDVLNALKGQEWGFNMAFGCSRGQFQYEVDVSHIELYGNEW